MNNAELSSDLQTTDGCRVKNQCDADKTHGCLSQDEMNEKMNKCKMLMERYDSLYKQLIDIYHRTLEGHRADSERLRLVKKENRRLTSIAKDVNTKASLLISKCGFDKDRKVDNDVCDDDELTVEVSTNTTIPIIS